MVDICNSVLVLFSAIDGPGRSIKLWLCDVVVSRSTEAEVLRPHRQWLLHPPDSPAGGQGPGWAAPDADGGADAAGHGSQSLTSSSSSWMASEQAAGGWVTLPISLAHSHRRSGAASPASWPSWRPASRPWRQGTSRQALPRPVSGTSSVWTRPPPPWRALRPRRGAHRTAPDQGPPSPRTPPTPAAGSGHSARAGPY